MNQQPAQADRLPDGVLIAPLELHEDERGCLAEIYRRSWPTVISPVQWNAVHSRPGTLRGFHLHVRHSDYLVTVSGRMLLALRDVRPESPTHELSAVLDLRGDRPLGVTIPPGVGHAFYFPEPSFLVYSVDEYWSPLDELGCHWNDDALQLPWSVEDPVLSPRDREAGSYKEMVEEFLRQTRLSGDAPRPHMGASRG
ncbi:dTDP-4-dehydrorhamnose 3,5-epimerase family protein [Parvibaculum sp.]|uniref:dTDP-4-dehydrorhamnose 3,5-epimerase family protein n=1 Tax=Parvibaculum sp. TaxID=2024848 RepID=UPI00391AC00F